jgi:hypothetical protein
VWSRAELAYLCNDLGLLTSAVELGVWRADYSREFLDRWEGSPMYLVDPWDKLADYEDIRNDDFDPEDYDYARRSLAGYGSRAVTLRMTSSEALDHLPLNLDFVYIDANHKYKYVVRDIYDYWIRVRAGGILAGHDIFSMTHPGVTEAVLEFCILEEMDCWIVRGDYVADVLVNAHSWFIVKGTYDDSVPLTRCGVRDESVKPSHSRNRWLQ